MNLVTGLVLALLLLWLGLSLRRVKRKKAAAFGCGGDCGKCLAACAYRRQQEADSSHAAAPDPADADAAPDPAEADAAAYANSAAAPAQDSAPPANP
ncbi:MAG: FeoB-associated Cys-rich membrane protein [Firmicutes bacterium]|nr:FeoB-associated Cys-rich membrane protein [Bacillota bacterium]